MAVEVARRMALRVPQPEAPEPQAAPGRVRLSDRLLQSLAVGKAYSHHKGAFTGLDFTHDGLHLATCGEDSGVQVYSCDRAQRVKHLRCQKHGVSLIRFLHNSRENAIAASRGKAEHVLRHWDLHENKYVRLFHGHTARATSLSPHPYEDILLSGSADCSVLLWDVRKDKPTAKISGQGPSIASFDQQGLVFAACMGQTKIHLFDTRNFAKGEFTCFNITPYLRCDHLVHSVQFSPCGKHLLARTTGQLLLVDAFNGELVCEYPIGADGGDDANHAAANAAPMLPGFSPDSQYVISGVPGGDVCIWEAPTARLVHCLEGHSSTALHAAFSPMHALVVTAAESLAWWIPDNGEPAAVG